MDPDRPSEVAAALLERAPGKRSPAAERVRKLELFAESLAETALTGLGMLRPFHRRSVPMD